MSVEWTSIVVMASLLAVVVQHWVHSRSLSRIMAQSDFYARAAQVNADKLVSKMIAMADPLAYERYRMASQAGVPEGSVPPPMIPEIQNGGSGPELLHRLKLLREAQGRRSAVPEGNGIYDEGPGEPT